MSSSPRLQELVKHPPRKPAEPRMSQGYRALLKLSRTAHIYLTLFGLLFILLFAVSGFLLNHEEWFSTGESYTHQTQGTMPARLLGREPDKLAVVEYLRSEHGARGAVESFELDPDQWHLVFKTPGQRSEIYVQTADGQMEIGHEIRGLMGVLMDLHRGKATGAVWSLIIDGTCVLLGIVSVTGLILWSSLRGRGQWGWLTLIFGAGLLGGVYCWAIP